MFNLKFSIDNAAFQNGDGREEIARILEETVEQIKNGRNQGSIMDINGNDVGSWSIKGRI